ncbi:aminotransferase class III-fold pyridoxal phosphate-dependent enzyme [Clostridium boliviensis]|uniref:Aminotransferase class III-fold pyridoxal phosphate-dependent enzyme n=1 Tax=Clostridium boliviensis TaxID=318465 RepID=A0ABU4GER3_9CLOT|nr:aminotransferase class III-fold pyridoxal phosphate-dependent enzyme [Clostridium boliviensis]MDW2796105.1 aminotransferase class III-fold pyridoxal phosphate-dependent enzyme [Clostridium boliviensis]
MKNKCDKRLRLFARPKTTLTLSPSEHDMLVTEEYGDLVDLESGCWSAVLGHSKYTLQEAIRDLKYPVHTHQFFDCPHFDKLVQRLTDSAKLPVPYCAAFLSSGTEAVSLCVMLTELLTSRHKCLSLTISYLGAACGLRMPRDPEKWTDINPADCFHCPMEKHCDHCTKFQSIDFSSYASFVLEPGNSGGLLLFPPNKLIKFIATRIKAAGGMLIMNEVTTGIGRTGKFFGYQHYEEFCQPDLCPDFIAMGKNLGNGYPISGVLVASRYQSQLEKSGFRYVQSHSDDPLGTIVALKTLTAIAQQNLVAQAERKGELLRMQLNDSPFIKEFRGKGLMNGIILQPNIHAENVYEELLKEGFFTGFSENYNLIRIYAPLSTTEDTLITFCHIFLRILKEQGKSS